MTNIIKFPTSDEDTNYVKGGDGDFLVNFNDEVFIGFDNGVPSISLGGKTVSMTRKKLAKLLWASAYLVDSEQRWAEDEFPCQNYDN